MIPLRLALVIAALLSLSACSRKAAGPATGAGGSAQPEYTAIADVPAELRGQCEAFAKQLEKDMQAKKTPAVRSAFDRAAIAEAMCRGLRSSDRRVGQFKAGLERGLQTGIERIASLWSNQEAKFKGLVIYKGETAARFRFVSDDRGITLVDLVLGKDAQGKIRIIGFYNHALGYDMVEQGRQSAAPLLAELDRSFLERLLERPAVSSADINRFAEFAKKTAAGDWHGAIVSYRSLPATLRETLAATGMYIAALQQSHDNAGYKAALKEAGARFKSANFQFMLVDLYFLEKKYDEAVRCLEAFMQAVERDAALLTLKSLLLKAKGDATGARAALQEALALEPDCVYAHLKGLDVLLAAKDFPAVRESLLFLEQQRGYKFKGAMTDPVWDDFKKSPEAAQWR